jgi:hypothetical protein
MSDGTAHGLMRRFVTPNLAHLRLRNVFQPFYPRKGKYINVQNFFVRALI